MNRYGAAVLVLLSLSTLAVDAGVGRALKQANKIGPTATAGASITVSASKPNVDAIAITPVLPYPQTAYYCNITGDSRIPADGQVFPLEVRVPVGVAAKVIFANITGTIPGTSSGCVSSVVQQPGTSISVGSSVVQPGTSSSVVQPGTSSSVVQPGTSSSVVQPGTSASASASSVVQPGTATVVQPGTSQVVQPGTSQVVQPGTSQVVQPGTSQVVQPGTSQVVQPGTSQVVQPGTSQVVQPGTSQVVQPGTSQVVQPGTSQVVQPGTSSQVVQPGTSQVTQPGTKAANTTSPPLCSSTPTTVVQQPTAVVQQPGTPGVQSTSVASLVVSGRRLSADLKPAPIEFISNNGSTGQPQLSVLDTVEGVPNIVFTPTAKGQTASFSGALQLAVTTTKDGFGVPYIPYQIDPKLSPNCGLLVKFIAI